MNLLQINKEQKRYERFIKHVRVEKNGCWNWQAFKDRDGYGEFRFSTEKHKKAHRYSYEIHKDEIPAGLVIDHLCKNPSCTNPEHLEAVTNQVNSERAGSFKGLMKFIENRSPEDIVKQSLLASRAAAEKKLQATHCKRGHEFTASNTYINPKVGHRVCKTCREVCLVRSRQNNKLKRGK